MRFSFYINIVTIFIFNQLEANFTGKKYETAPDYLFPSKQCQDMDIPLPGQKKRLYTLRHAYYPAIICHARCSEICPLGRKLGCSWFSLIKPTFCLGQLKPRDHGLPSKCVQDKPRSAFPIDCSICGVFNWWLIPSSMFIMLMILKIPS